MKHKSFSTCYFCNERIELRKDGRMKKHTYRFYYWQKPRLCPAWKMSRAIAAVKGEKLTT